MSLVLGALTSDRVTIGVISPLSAYTVMGWFNATTLTPGRRIMSNADWLSPFGAMDLRIGASNFYRSEVTRATSLSQYVANNRAATTNLWIFLAATFDIAAGAGQVGDIYSGSLTELATEVTYGTATDGVGAVVASTLALTLGNIPAANSALQGRLGPLLIFERKMTQGEIQSHQFDPRMAVGGFGFWRLGDTGTGVQPDYSGNGRAGTVVGCSQGDNPPLPRPWRR